MRKHLLTLCSLLALSCSSALGATEQWVEVKSDHFTVITDANEKQGRQILDQFERMRWMFHTLFPKTNVDPPEPIEVLAARNYKVFQTLEPAEYLAKGQLRLGGLFLKTQDRNFVLLCLDAAEEHPFATVYHEYTHLQFSKSRDWLPLWLDEGLAEFIQNTDIHEKNVMVGQPSTSDILYLRENRLIPLETLLRVDHNSPYYHDEQKGSVFYAEAWALTHYLEVNDHDKHSHQIDDYLARMRNHEESVEAAQKAFGNLKDLEASLASYIRDGRYKEFVLNSAAAPLDEASYRARQLMPVESDAQRAAFLANVGRKADSLALLDSVLQADPKNATAFETKGYLAFRDGDLESARKWYGEAVKFDSQSYLANYYYAAMSLQVASSEEDAQIEASLRNAIRLKSDFAPPYDTLAIFLLRQQKNLDEAYMLEVQAIQLDRTNFGYRMNASSILMARGKYSDATSALQIARNLAKSPSEQAMLQRNMEAVTQMQQASERMTLATETVPNSSVTTTTAHGITLRSAAGTEAEMKPKHPIGPPTGPKHEAIGNIQHVECSYPAILDLQLVNAKGKLSLYSGNYYQLDLSALGFDPKREMSPCKDMEGFLARITYAGSSDKTVDGQIVSIELRK